MAAALASPPAPARSQRSVCPPPRLTTSITWHPPSVEDTVDEEDGHETPCAKDDAPSPATPAALATPATSVTSFESDTHDEREDSPLPLPPPPQDPSYRSNTSAPLARPAPSCSRRRPSPWVDDASTRVLPEPRTDEVHGGYRQVGKRYIPSLIIIFSSHMPSHTPGHMEGRKAEGV